jgi:hypothetical protein
MYDKVMICFYVTIIIYFKIKTLTECFICKFTNVRAFFYDLQSLYLVHLTTFSYLRRPSFNNIDFDVLITYKFL